MTYEVVTLSSKDLGGEQKIKIWMSKSAFHKKPSQELIIHISYWVIVLLFNLIFVLDQFEYDPFGIAARILWICTFLGHPVAACFPMSKDPTSKKIKALIQGYLSYKKYLNFRLDPKKCKYHCEKCSLSVEFTTRHCKRCQTCVARYDTHCLWLNTCIGHQNRK